MFLDELYVADYVLEGSEGTPFAGLFGCDIGQAAYLSFFAGVFLQ